jgi:hypothetical protein
MEDIKLKHHHTGILCEPCKFNIFLNFACTRGNECKHAHITNIGNVNDEFKTGLSAWVDAHPTLATWAKDAKPNGW